MRDAGDFREASPPGGGGIEEAPIDGNPYSRQDAGWVPAAGGGADDTFELQFGRRSNVAAGARLQQVGGQMTNSGQPITRAAEIVAWAFVLNDVSSPLTGGIRIDVTDNGGVVTSTVLLKAATESGGSRYGNDDTITPIPVPKGGRIAVYAANEVIGVPTGVAQMNVGLRLK